MLKLFSVAEANALIPMVAAVIDDMQSAVRDLNALQGRLQMTSAYSVSGYNLAIEANFLAASLQENQVRLERLGVLLQDIERGIVVFPSLLGAEVVYLCWQPGEDTITYYYGVLQPIKGNLDDRLPLPVSALPVTTLEAGVTNTQHA